MMQVKTLVAQSLYSSSRIHFSTSINHVSDYDPQRVHGGHERKHLEQTRH